MIALQAATLLLAALALVAAVHTFIFAASNAFYQRRIRTSVFDNPKPWYVRYFDWLNDGIFGMKWEHDDSLYGDIGEYRYCEEHDAVFMIVDSREEQAGYEEKARRIWVTSLQCGHDIEIPLPRWPR